MSKEQNTEVQESKRKLPTPAYRLSTDRRGWERIIEVTRALLGFSRVIIATFALAQAGLGAVLALQKLPPLRITLIGAIAVLSASYALTATNDMLDVKIDKKRFQSLRDFKGFDVGSLFIRHPLAQGVISYKIAISWIASLSVISMVFTFFLKPWLIGLFLIMVVLVSLYSFLNTITTWKIFIIAVFVALGAVAGWLAVASPTPLLYIFALWMFCWEMGGRNIPNDFADVDEDMNLGLKTIPTVFGAKVASRVAFVFLILTCLTAIAIAVFAKLGLFFLVSSMILGAILLLRPGYKLLKDPKPEISLQLFNFSTLYPLFMIFLLLFTFYVF